MLKKFHKTFVRKSNGWSKFQNGYVITDEEVGKRAWKRLGVIDRLFSPSKVASEILWAHTELAEKVQDLPPKEES